MEALQEILAKLIGENIFALIVAIIGSILAIAKSITVMTPSTSENKIVHGILTVLNWLALNVFKDKNADAKKNADVKENNG